MIRNKKNIITILKNYSINLKLDKKFILVTGHRRESFGKGFKNICSAISEVAHSNNGIHFIFPVHLNPNVQVPVYKILKDIVNVSLIPPQDYLPFIYLMKKAYIILTDSGGVQEEAPSLGKPVLVMRDNTERPEGIDAGTSILVGTSIRTIKKEIETLIRNKNYYKKVCMVKNPYGDGRASQKIYDIISSKLIQ